MADGYGFGGEGDWKTSVMLRTLKVMAERAARRHVVHGGLHLPPGPRRGEDPRRAHARGLPVDRGGQADGSRSTRSASAAARTRSGSSSTPTPGAAVVLGIADLGDRFRFVANEVDVVPPDAAAAESPGRPRRLATAAGPPHVDRGLADGRRPAPHRARRPRSPTEHLDDLAEMTGTELVLIDADTTVRSAHPGAAVEPGLPPAWRRACDEPRLGHGSLGAGRTRPPRKEWRDSAKSTFHHRRRQPGARPSRRAAGDDSGSGDGGDAGTVGVAMPTKSSERWIADGNNIKEQLEDAGY